MLTHKIVLLKSIKNTRCARTLRLKVARLLANGTLGWREQKVTKEINLESSGRLEEMKHNLYLLVATLLLFDTLLLSRKRQHLNCSYLFMNFWTAKDDKVILIFSQLPAWFAVLVEKGPLPLKVPPSREVHWHKDAEWTYLLNLLICSGKNKSIVLFKNGPMHQLTDQLVHL